ncbi:MAG: hypothetical protein OXQ29_28135 [Rhodospirillaceae bacterium]|nr:hypothetical protein [Rhodospirillaceae bacterium]
MAFSVNIPNVTIADRTLTACFSSLSSYRENYRRSGSRPLRIARGGPLREHPRALLAGIRPLKGNPVTILQNYLFLNGFLFTKYGSLTVLLRGFRAFFPMAAAGRLNRRQA